MLNDLQQVLNPRGGHFVLESGHHSDQWLDLELLCLEPACIRPLAVELAKRLSQLQLEAICGPLNEGAFVGLLVAAELSVEFYYAEPFTKDATGELFRVGYKVPGPLRVRARGKRVAIVNDVINAGSAIRGTFEDLLACGSVPVAIASLMVLGNSAAEFTRHIGLPLVSLAAQPNSLWLPEECPLCSQGVPVGTSVPYEYG